MKVKVILNQWHLKTIEWTISDSLWICESNRQYICNFTQPWLYLRLPICSNCRALAWEGVYVHKLAFFFWLRPRTYHFLFEKRLIIDWRYFWRNIALSLILERKIVSRDYPLKQKLSQLWTKESLRAHEARFYVQLRLVRSVLRASKFSVLKLIEIVTLWVYYTIPLGFNLFLALFGHHVWTFIKLLRSAQDHWRGLSTPNAHIV